MHTYALIAIIQLQIRLDIFQFSYHISFVRGLIMSFIQFFKWVLIFFLIMNFIYNFILQYETTVFCRVPFLDYVVTIIPYQ